MPRPRSLVLIGLLLVVGACGKPTSDATPEVRAQYLTIAHIAADRTDLDIPDDWWLDFADRVCARKLLTEEDYDELIAEIEFDAPTPELGRAARDVGQSAITLFCPPDL